MKLVLLDVAGYIYQGFHAIPPIVRPSDQMPCNAIQHFTKTLWKIKRRHKLHPDLKDAATHMVAIFDASGDNWRHDIYPDYKANRPPSPEALSVQKPFFREAAKAFNIPVVELAGYEADDLVATYAQRGRDEGYEVVIVSGDKDLMQLVRPGVTIFNPFKWQVIGEFEVIEKFGVPPHLVLDAQAMIGDSTDNIPGVPGIGQKTAAELLKQYGTLDEILACAEMIPQPKRRQSLIECANQARMSRTLAWLADDAPIDDPIESFEVRDMDPTMVLEFLEEMEFESLANEYRETLV